MVGWGVIERGRHLSAVGELLSWNPVVAVLGARQIGKTTLARELVARLGTQATVFDLESPDDLAVLQEPMLALRHLQGLVVIDEIQRRPGLFPILRVLADRPQTPARFLILGSASPELLQQSSESLAGRISYYELGPLALDEVGVESLHKLWFRGGFPRSYLAESDDRSTRWRRDFVRAFLERDLPALGIRIPPGTLERFWSMLAHYHGELWKGAELARAFGVTDSTVRRYLEILCSTFVVRKLQPWHENIGKRQVKAPKIYFRDSGLLNTLLRIDSAEELARHPKVGASWEGFGLDAVTVRLGVEADRCYFWRTHTGAELDLLVTHKGRKLGFEFKRTSSPRITRSMYSALNDLGLESIDLIHAGERTFPLSERVRAVALSRLWHDLEPLSRRC
jgi:predicted AAA+ superfamily ATPase